MDEGRYQDLIVNGNLRRIRCNQRQQLDFLTVFLEQLIAIADELQRTETIPSELAKVVASSNKSFDSLKAQVQSCGVQDDKYKNILNNTIGFFIDWDCYVEEKDLGKFIKLLQSCFMEERSRLELEFSASINLSTEDLQAIEKMIRSESVTNFELEKVFANELIMFRELCFNSTEPVNDMITDLLQYLELIKTDANNIFVSNYFYALIDLYLSKKLENKKLLFLNKFPEKVYSSDYNLEIGRFIFKLIAAGLNDEAEQLRLRIFCINEQIFNSEQSYFIQLNLLESVQHKMLQDHDLLRKVISLDEELSEHIFVIESFLVELEELELYEVIEDLKKYGVVLSSYIDEFYSSNVLDLLLFREIRRSLVSEVGFRKEFFSLEPNEIFSLNNYLYFSEEEAMLSTPYSFYLNGHSNIVKLCINELACRTSEEEFFSACNKDFCLYSQVCECKDLEILELLLSKFGYPGNNFIFNSKGCNLVNLCILYNFHQGLASIMRNSFFVLLELDRKDCFGNDAFELAFYLKDLESFKLLLSYRSTTLELDDNYKKYYNLVKDRPSWLEVLNVYNQEFSTEQTNKRVRFL